MSGRGGLSDRESKLLLKLLEMEATNARMIAEHWEKTAVEDHKAGAESLAYEQAYASGRATSAEQAAQTLKDLLGG